MTSSKASVLLAAALAALLLPASVLGTGCCACRYSTEAGVACGDDVGASSGGDSCLKTYGPNRPNCLLADPTSSGGGYCATVADALLYYANAVVLSGGCLPPTRGDPILADFTGTSFELVGEAGKWFNLVSEATHNLNMHLVSANISTKAGGGTLIDAIAMLYDGNKLEMSVDEAGELTVTINGKAVTKDDLLNAADHSLQIPLEDGTAVNVALYRAYMGHSMQVMTPLLNATFFATNPGFDAYYQQDLRAYLNFYMGLTDTRVSGIHGLLGQTAPNSFAAKPKNATATSSIAIQPFSGEGEEADYIVDAAFATEYKFSQYGTAPTKPQALNVARRSLLDNATPVVFATMKLHA